MWVNSKAYTFIFLMGIVSLFSDITYESAKSLTGPYLAFLGASAFYVSAISGLGEFLGYNLRLVSGYLSDRLKSYWAFTFFGYTLNLLAVPALAFVSTWQWASVLILLERIGKAIRTPSRDVLLSHATQKVGHGRGFGIHEFLDQIGAITGPLFVSFVIYKFGSYQMAFGSLFVPAIVALTTLFVAKRFYTNNVEVHESSSDVKKVPKGLLFYLLATFFLGLSFIHFPLMAYHQKNLGLEGYLISLFYAFAMLVDAVAAVLFGYLFDKKGSMVLPIGIAIGTMYPLFVFSGEFVIFGVALWGALLGIQESILRSWIAQNVPLYSRAFAYGLLYFVLGLATLLGSVLVGFLYSLGIYYAVVYSLALGLLSSLTFLLAIRRHSA